MSQHLTISYLTARKNPQIEWFYDSLENQIISTGIERHSISLVIVDFYRNERELPLPKNIGRVHWISPKPSVWNGPHRLTKENWFDAAGSRNTSICLAPDGWLAYVDDLSVLSPQWLSNVIASMKWNGVTLGAYRKVKSLVVENGLIKSFDESWTGGKDSRWSVGSDSGSVACNGDMLYGCSLLAPVEAFLSVGSWPEICSGLGMEDVAMGQAMENAGWPFMYNRNMFTYESEEHHGLEPAFRRESFEKHPHDKTDKAHAVLNMVKNGVKYFENYYEGGIRKMREEVLSGKPFPILNNPQHDWHTGVALKDL